MLFKDIIGQDGVKHQLVEMVRQNRLSHALLFLGKEGSGALPLAMAFSQYISLLPSFNSIQSNDQSLFGLESSKETEFPSSPLEADDWMQNQPSYLKANKMIHPDIHFSYPVITKKSGTPPLSTDYVTEWREFIEEYPYRNVYDWLQFIGAENKQGNITAQECNDIIRKLNLKSFESGYKILVLWMPEYLGKEGNKLLKLIEEPPADTLFILVAENESSILSTIVSRCQLVKVPAIDTHSIEKALIEKSRQPVEQAKQIANVCEGNYREALHIMQHADEDFQGLLKDWLNATLKNQPIHLVKSIEEINRLGRENQKQFIKYFTHLLEQAIRLRSYGENRGIDLSGQFSGPEKELVPRLNKAMTLEQQDAISRELDKASYYIERNANAKILFHALSIKIFHIVKNNVIITV